MNKPRLVGATLIVFVLMAMLQVFPGPQQEDRPAQDQGANERGDFLPAVLADFYPPKATEPVFLFKMIGLAESFSGILSDLFENDLPNALANFQKFKVQYSELSGLVSEWKTLYPPAPVEDLGSSLKTGDQAKVIAAVQKVGGVCSACHIEYMARVQHRYGWPDFYAIRAKDPLTGEEVDLHQLMVYLDVNFSGIGADLSQGQAENAQKHLQGFKARFEAMAGTCQECHGPDERKYYIDNSVRVMMEELGKTVADASPEKAGKLVTGIGMESCHKCHLVHIPAAFSQKKWKR